MVNVVSMSSAARKAAKPMAVQIQSENISFENIYELTKFVAGEIRLSKMKYNKIAEKASCCSATVSNIAHGVTRDPRASTVIKILQVLGYRVAVRR